MDYVERFNVGDGWLDVTRSEPGNLWMAAHAPFDTEHVTGGPWLSTDHPDMPVEGDDPEVVAEAMLGGWPASRLTSARGSPRRRL